MYYILRADTMQVLETNHEMSEKIAQEAANHFGCDVEVIRGEMVFSAQAETKEAEVQPDNISIAQSYLVSKTGKKDELNWQFNSSGTVFGCQFKSGDAGGYASVEKTAYGLNIHVNGTPIVMLDMFYGAHEELLKEFAGHDEKLWWALGDVETGEVRIVPNFLKIDKGE